MSNSLLESAVWVQNAERQAQASHSELINHEGRTGPDSLYDDIRGQPGMTGGVYRLLSTTNLNGHQFPREFLFENYRPGAEPRGRLARRFIGTVTNIVLGEADPGRFVDVVFGIADFRYTDKPLKIESVSYLSTNLFPDFPNDLGLVSFREKVQQRGFKGRIMQLVRLYNPITGAASGLGSLFLLVLLIFLALAYGTFQCRSGRTWGSRARPRL
jgi:hypothetical protein